jgi:hypothetical protein
MAVRASIEMRRRLMARFKSIDELSSDGGMQDLVKACRDGRARFLVLGACIGRGLSTC